MKLKHPYGIIQLEVPECWQELAQGFTLFSMAHKSGSYWLSSTPVPKPEGLEDLNTYTDNVLTVYRDQMKSMRNVKVKDVSVCNFPAKRIDFDEFLIKTLPRKSVKMIVGVTHYFVIFNVYWKKKSDKKVALEIIENLPSFLSIHDLNITDPNEILGKTEEDSSIDSEEDENDDLLEEQESIPELLEALKKPEAIEAIDLSQAYITDIPEELAQLTNLKKIDLSQNYFNELPHFMSKLKKIEQIHLISCPISTLPDWIEELENLKELYLTNCLLRFLPSSLKKLKKLEVLDLSGNDLLGEIPDVVGQLTQLRRLELARCALEKIKTDFFNDLHLTYLNLGHNDIASLPQSLFNQGKLSELCLADNELTQINYAWNNLGSIKFLDLSNNNIGDLSPKLYKNESLRRLTLTNCKLNSIDSAIGNLKHLKELYLEGNDFVSLPSCLKDMGSVDIQIGTKYRALYEDISYQAPRPKSPITDKQIYARFDKEMISLLCEKMVSGKWDHVRDGLKAIALKGIGLKSAMQCPEKSIGLTKLGGSPDLPTDIPYPKDENGMLWIFLAQLKLSDFRPYNDFLPRTGYLWFFIKDLDEFEPLVYYGDNQPEDLAPFLREDAMAFSDCDLDDFYPGYSAEIKPYPSLPYFYNEDFVYELEGAEKLSDYPDILEQVPEALHFSLFEKMDYGNDIHTINTYLFSQNESPQKLAADQKGGEEKDWIVLLSLGHDNNTGFCFWDAGTLYFLIHKDDLANSDFSRIYCALESS